MDIYYADDSRQTSPSREGLSSLVAVGGICVPEGKVDELEKEIDKICGDFGFPEREEFKWSPSPGAWMRSNLVAERRKSFFIAVLNGLIKANVESTVAIVDSAFDRATDALTPEMDATELFLERVCNRLKPDQQASVITDKPGGGSNEEKIFLKECIEAFKNDSNYTRIENIHSIACSSSHSTRLLQCADLITGSTVSHVGGGSLQYSQPIFDVAKRTFARGRDTIGGVGLKLHPDIRLRNLYHWLLGDTLFWKRLRRWNIPQEGKPYFNDENTA